MKPFLTNRKSSGTAALTANAVPPALGAKATLRGAPLTAAPVLPAIEAVKEGDKVVRLIVTCACGERMEVECIYPAGA